jgi:lipopolysaccharide/colanic/teichoic acid biosynthesis glycosyltransferase
VADRPSVPLRADLGARARRAVDILVSATALAVLIPLFLLIAVVIKATSPGPVLYSQIRVGQNRRRRERRSTTPGPDGDRRRRRDRRGSRAHGRPFRIWKFRTMVVNAEEYGPRWSSRRDPRITPFGRLLRLTRLDETPQFWNVLVGDMSLIGPRPERPYFVDQFAESIPHYPRRLHVRPGITGQAQVNLSYDSSVDDVKRKLDQDLDYVSKRSWKRDLRILLRTVGVVITGKGAA